MKIHLIGIGGIGVSALAQYYATKGHQVSGSDLVESEITDLVKEKGIKVLIGNSAEHISTNLDLVVCSPAVKPDNPEYKMAKELNIKIQTYPEALGELTKEYFTIAVAGAHGKSTTTAMLGLVLIDAGLDPTVIVGTKVKEFSPITGGSNFREGKSKILVIEACEYDSSFLQYWPKIIVITNIDKEHLDYFKNFAGVKKAFKNFIARLPIDGHLVFNKDDKYAPKLIKPKFRITSFSIKKKGVNVLKKALKVPGMHNVSNALAVLAVSKIMAVPNKTALDALSKFSGTWRRFEIKEGSADGKKITVISDYGHHPSEITATLKATREKYKKEKIWCVFQPHQHQRTFYLFNEFVKTFRAAPVDNLIITDIYDVAGRETTKINDQVSAEKLVKKIDRKNIIYMPTLEITRFIKEKIGVNDILLIMGAGDIYKLTEKF